MDTVLSIKESKMLLTPWLVLFRVCVLKLKIYFSYSERSEHQYPLNKPEADCMYLHTQDAAAIQFYLKCPKRKEAKVL
jgi:hypothetical protein